MLYRLRDSSPYTRSGLPLLRRCRRPQSRHWVCRGMKGTNLAIQPSDVRAAAERIRPLARRTPVFTSSVFDAEAGMRVFFKCENLQKGGAFKIRGAANLILSLPPAALFRALLPYSPGNHAQAPAFAARHVGAAATIVMPEDAPRSKMEATRCYGPR